MDPSNYSSTIHNMARLDVNMEYITEINARLREMKQVEEQMNTTRMQVLAQRQLEDADWYQRVQAHDAEEAVSLPMRRKPLPQCVHKMIDVANVMAETEK